MGMLILANVAMAPVGELARSACDWRILQRIFRCLASWRCSASPVQTGLIMLEYINLIKSSGQLHTFVVDAAVEGAVLRLRPIAVTMLVASSLGFFRLRFVPCYRIKLAAAICHCHCGGTHMAALAMSIFPACPTLYASGLLGTEIHFLLRKQGFHLSTDFFFTLKHCRRPERSLRSRCCWSHRGWYQRQIGLTWEQSERRSLRRSIQHAESRYRQRGRDASRGDHSLSSP